ncbi:hypothetical protein HanIR_Chr09g0416401 [Helianthus annuus]|nr:hypothetical protein HanIR_Chr09g0416401 [Helianthus annuus]
MECFGKRTNRWRVGHDNEHERITAEYFSGINHGKLWGVFARRFDQRNLKPSGAEETKMALSKAKARHGNRFLKPLCLHYSSIVHHRPSYTGRNIIKSLRTT